MLTTRDLSIMVQYEPFDRTVSCRVRAAYPLRILQVTNVFAGEGIRTESLEYVLKAIKESHSETFVWLLQHAKETQPGYSSAEITFDQLIATTKYLKETN